MEWVNVQDVIEGESDNFENCIYLWRNKKNEKLYVGQAKNFRKRTKEHKYDSFNRKSKKYDLPLHKAVRKYGIKNFEIYILEKDLNDYAEMDQKEIYYIKKFDTLAKHEKGYNVAEGGGNGNNFVGKTEDEMREISEKMSKAHSGENNSMYGKQHSDEAKEKMSKAHSGENNPMYGRTGENNPQSRAVICLNTGVIYGSTREAERQTGIAYQSIIANCRGKLKSAGVIDSKPAVWMHYSDYEKLSKEEVNEIKNEEVPNRNRSKAVICITTGKIYESIMEAERQTGIDRTSISRCCNGKQRSTKDSITGEKLIFMFLEDYESLK